MKKHSNLIQETNQSIAAIKGEMKPEFEEILSPAAVDFLYALHQKFNARCNALITQREERQKAIDKGQIPNFLEETAAIKDSDWVVAPLPQDLLDRRVEITRPVDRKMVINALNSGAEVFMADLEDSNTPNWNNNIQGQINLRDAVNGTIDFTSPKNGKFYQLREKTATLMVRPRG